MGHWSKRMIRIGILGVASNYLLVALEKRMFRWWAAAN
jgi:hypothetical protein